MEITREINGLGSNKALLEFLGEVRKLTPNTLGNLSRGNLAVFLVDDAISPANQIAVQNALNSIDTLSINKNKAAILPNGTDTVTFTHNTAQPSVKWFCYRDGELYASGTEAAVAGVVTLTLAVNVAGTYAVHIVNLNGVGSGSSQVLAEA
jgi:hypothetical protein